MTSQVNVRLKVESPLLIPDALELAHIPDFKSAILTRRHKRIERRQEVDSSN